MRDVYIASDNIISSLGFTTSENAAMLQTEKTGIQLHEDSALSPVPFWASMIDRERMDDHFTLLGDSKQYSRFEKLILLSIHDALSQCNVDICSDRTQVILSTTKGNIDLLDSRLTGNLDASRVYLWQSAEIVKQFFGLARKPLIVSNACISGVLAILIGARMIRWGKADHIIIVGADLVTEFVLSGFSSFLSLCNGPCKPFDKDRQGLSLGEAAGTLVLTADIKNTKDIVLKAGSGFSSNDANHISGPSRTGEGLYIAINRTLADNEDSIPDYISAHGTATPYNDEMESIAITRAGLQNIAVNSLKGYWGHTLGAAGIIEAVAGIYSMKHNQIFGTLGLEHPGVSNPLNVIKHSKKQQIHSFLKIASGFGGSNAAILFTK